MSVVRLALVLVMTMHALTCALTIGLVMPTVDRQLAERLAEQSRAEASTIVRELASGALRREALVTDLGERARRRGWHSFDLKGVDGTTRASLEAPESPLAANWYEAAARVRLSQDDAEIGTLVLTASSAEADTMLRNAWLGLVLIFATTGALMVFVSLRVVAWARKPLADFHVQVLGLSERRPVVLEDPKVSEWVEVSKSLNMMIARVQLMIDDRDRLADNLQQRLDQDALTQTHSRESFMGKAREALVREGPEGAIAIVRLHDLEGLNRRIGRGRTDEFLASAATILRAKLLQMASVDSHVLGRLNGADFGVLLKRVDAVELQTQLEVLSDALSSLSADGLTDEPFVAWIGASTYRKDESLSDVLTRVDAMVATSVSQRIAFCIAEPSGARTTIAVAQWRVILETALDTGRLALDFHPVVDRGGALMHREAMLRLVEPNGHVLEAVEFIPAAIRCGRISELDLKAVELALAALDAAPGRVAVNLAQQSLAHPIFLSRLDQLLKSHRESAPRLSFELRELDLVTEDWQPTALLARVVGPFGCRVGIDHFGLTLSAMPVLTTGCIGYVKLSPQLTARLFGEPRVKSFVALLIEMSKRLDYEVIGNGLQTRDDIETLFSMGVDGVTGPAVTLSTREPVPA